jgi:hypothetical protein
VIPSVRRLTQHWSIRLGEAFSARLDGKNLVFVAPGRTLVIAIWGAKNGLPPEQILDGLKKAAFPKPIERYEISNPSLKGFGYFLLESDDSQGTRWAFYAFSLAVRGHLQMAFYFDEKEDLEWARGTWNSVEFTP